MALITRAGKLWPGGIVPFSIDLNVNSDIRVQITAGIALITNTVHGIEFVKHNHEPNYIHFIEHPDPFHQGSESHTGMAVGPRFIFISAHLSKATVTQGAAKIAHEICHALCLLHEQNRSDRDQFVVINWSNIALIHRDQFQSSSSEQPEDFGPYDKSSITHYFRHTYAIDKSIDTITPIVPPPDALGDFSGTYLSSGDIAALNSLYPASLPSSESSDTGPALASRNDGTLLMAWKGNGNSGLATMTSTNGRFFSNWKSLNEQSDNAPALAVHNNKFVVAWTGTGIPKLNIMQSDDGVNWHSKQTLSDFSPSAPALFHIGAEIFMAWRGGDDRLNLMRSFDGIHWWGKRTPQETTELGPALSAVGPVLLLAWRGKGNNRLNILTAPGGIPDGRKKTLDDTTEDRPAICTMGTRAFLAWSGKDNHFMNVMGSDDGREWNNKIIVDTEILRGGPAIASWENILVRAWTDSSSFLWSRPFPRL